MSEGQIVQVSFWLVDPPELSALNLTDLRKFVTQVAGYASDDLATAASKAVNSCLRASEDLNLVLQQSLSYPSTHAETVRSKICAVLSAIDSLVQTVPVQPRVTAVANSCGGSNVYSEERSVDSDSHLIQLESIHIC